MGQLLQIILDNLFKLWPIRVIDTDCQGVRFTLGDPAEKLEPGWYLHCPGLQKIEEWAVKYQELDCATQSVETRDGVSITFSANAGYTIEDAAKMRTEVHDFDSTLERSLRGCLAKAVAKMNHADLVEKREKIARWTLRSLRRETAAWGVTIKRVRWTDFTRSEQQRRFVTN